MVILNATFLKANIIGLFEIFLLLCYTCMVIIDYTNNTKDPSLGLVHINETMCCKQKKDKFYVTVVNGE